MKRWKYTIVLLLTVLVGGCSSLANNKTEVEITNVVNSYGGVKLESVWDGNRLLTVVIKGGN